MHPACLLIAPVAVIHYHILQLLAMFCIQQLSGWLSFHYYCLINWLASMHVRQLFIRTLRNRIQHNVQVHLELKNFHIRTRGRLKSVEDSIISKFGRIQVNSVLFLSTVWPNTVAYHLRHKSNLTFSSSVDKSFIRFNQHGKVILCLRFKFNETVDFIWMQGVRVEWKGDFFGGYKK